MLAFATIGPAALYLLFIWLLSAAGAAWLAERKGYTERVGLMFGLILSAVGLIIVLLLPGRPGSTWKLEGPLPNPGARRPLGLSAVGPLAGASEAPETAGPALPDSPGAADAPGTGQSPGEPPGAEPPQRG
ncbi:MAG: hypothetical protein ACJ780_22330 [Solirubrobacteraceae bacterium]